MEFLKSKKTVRMHKLLSVSKKSIPLGHSFKFLDGTKK